MNNNVINIPLEGLKTWHGARLLGYYHAIMTVCPEDNIKLENVCTALKEKPFEERMDLYRALQRNVDGLYASEAYEMIAYADKIAEDFWDKVISCSIGRRGL